MCLITKDKKLHIAYKNIPIYKVLEINSINRLSTPFRHYPITSRTIVPESKWNFLELLDGILLGFKQNSYIENGFIHCYHPNTPYDITWDNRHVKMEGYIPIGSIYAIGMDGDLCATKIILNKEDWNKYENKINNRCNY